MRLRLEKRPKRSAIMALASPLIALSLTLICGAIFLSAIGKNPAEGLYYLFLEPLTDAWLLEEVLVKTAPLALIAAGLSICFAANVWNIGAEGQFVAGAILGSALPVLVSDFQNAAVLPMMLIFGFLGGALLALIPALLRVRFGASEILTSLMLVYVAQLFLDWLVRGPWRNPAGSNFPGTVRFHEWAQMPQLGDSRLHVGLLVAILIGAALAFALSRSYAGFSLRLSGSAPAAARFAGVSRDRVVIGVMALSGGLAGLAGVMEVAGPIGHLREVISPGYGFTAIIVAFLARLNPAGALISALVLSITFVGGEGAQMTIGVSDKITRVIQGVLLFFVLASDVLIWRKIVWERRAPAVVGATKMEGA